jgi:DNA-binding MarR family transcriptional regulator
MMNIPIPTLLDIIQNYSRFSNQQAMDYATFIRLAHADLVRAEGDAEASEHDALHTLRMLSYSLQRVSRIARQLGKKTLAGSPLSSIEEFTVINTVYNRQPISKSELNRIVVLEATTSTQLTRRLVQAGLLLESQDLNDRRSWLLSLTEAGEALRHATFAALEPEIRFKFKSLTPEEQRQLLTLLRKMDADLAEEV